MKAARRIRRVTERGEVRDEHVSVEVPSARVKPIDEPTAAELRRRRDLVWLMLAKQGLNAVEISKACQLAACTPQHIRNRLRQCENFHRRMAGG
jgi:hypothetical protein